MVPNLGCWSARAAPRCRLFRILLESHRRQLRQELAGESRIDEEEQTLGGMIDHDQFVELVANALGFALWAGVLSLISAGGHTFAPGPFLAHSVWESVARLVATTVR